MKRHRLPLGVVILSSTATLLFILFFVFGFHKRQTAPMVQAADKTMVAQSSLPKKLNYGLPVRLVIPKLNVNTTVEDMRLTAAGNMAVPTDVVGVGWYEYGPHPGNKGSAVMAGHLDGLQGQPGVFAQLDKLQQGDQVLVVDDTGKTVSFVVRETRTYGQDEQPSEVFNSSDGSHINLITCTGDWYASQHSYAKRLVVFADKSE